MSTAFVLVHGGAHGAWCWDPLLPFLDGPVLAVDLPPKAVRGLPAPPAGDVAARARARSRRRLRATRRSPTSTPRASTASCSSATRWRALDPGGRPAHPRTGRASRVRVAHRCRRRAATSSTRCPTSCGRSCARRCEAAKARRRRRRWRARRGHRPLHVLQRHGRGADRASCSTTLCPEGTNLITEPVSRAGIPPDAPEDLRAAAARPVAAARHADADDRQPRRVAGRRRSPSSSSTRATT